MTLAPCLTVHVNPYVPMPVAAGSPRLRLITDKEPDDAMADDDQSPKRAPQAQRAVALTALEVIVDDEDWFLRKVRRTIRMGVSEADADEIINALNIDHVVQMARFLFLLLALDCKSPDKIGRFIEAHNRKIKDELDSGEFPGSRKEREKLIIKDARRGKIIAAFTRFNKPTFTITELANLMGDFMSEGSATRMIADFKRVKFFSAVEYAEEERDFVDGKRKLLQSTGLLEALYATSLERTYDRIRAADAAPTVDTAAKLG